MKIKNMAKKVAAIGVGAAMLGATLTSALALQDLGNYPAPFVSDGVLDNSVIVVGESAATADVLGAIDIAAGLQAAAVSSEPIQGTTVDPSVSEGVKVEKAGNLFNYEDDIDTVLESTSLDSGDLPDMLGDGDFVDNQGETDNDEEFEQTLSFSSGNGIFNLYQDDDLAEEGGNYLFLDDAEFYTYTLEFDQSIEFDTTDASADFEGVNFEIQGHTYTISDVGLSSGEIDEMELLVGDSTIWLVQDQPYTLGDKTVTVVDVDNSETKCGVNVDGVTKWVDDGTTEDFGGLSIGVLDVVAVYTKDYDADTCQLSLGTSELILEDGGTVTVNGQELEGSEVTFSGSSGEWDGFTIVYTLGQEDDDDAPNDDEIYLAPGDAWTDPVFGNFKVMFEGVSANYEEMTFEASGEEATFSFVNIEGDEIDIPFFYDDTVQNQIMAGEDNDALLLKSGENLTGVNSAARDPEGALLWYVTSGGEAVILELDEVEGTSGAGANTTTIKDWMTGNTLADEEEFTPGSPELITLGSLGSVNLTLTAGASGNVVYHVSHGGGTAETENEATISFTRNSTTVTEVDGDEVAERAIYMELGWDSSDEEIQIQNPSATSLTQVDFSEDNDDDRIAVTERGTWIEWDSDNRDKLTLMYPDEAAYANVFIAPMSATTVVGESGELTADTVNPFSVGLAVLDSDAEGMSKNMIVVGGPCVNTVAADLMENPEVCTEGFEPGKAMLKYFERNGNDALLVAGYEAQDTVGASYVLADYDEYDLEGDEVEVVVTSLDQISVNTV